MYIANLLFKLKLRSPDSKICQNFTKIWYLSENEWNPKNYILAIENPKAYLRSHWNVSVRSRYLTWAEVNDLYFWLLLQAFGRFWTDTIPRSSSAVKRSLVVKNHYFLFPCREWSWHIVCGGGLLHIKKNRAYLLEINGISAIKPFSLTKLLFSWHYPLGLTCTSVEGRWGELGHLTHRHHGPAAKPEQPLPSWKHVIDLLWFGIQ